MTDPYEIPSTVVAYPEGGAPPTIDVSERGLQYTPSPNERVKVLLWVRYPAYDFIFGVPAKDSPMYEKEIGFFQYRDTRRRAVVEGFYLDVQETKEMLQGFQKILDASQEHSPHLWKPSK